MIGGILIRYLINSIYGGVFIAIAILIRLAAKDRVPRKYICILWLIVALRLIVPVSVESSYGVLPQITFGQMKPINMVQHSYSNEPVIQASEYDEDQSPTAEEISTESTITDDQDNVENITETPITNPTVSAFADIWLFGFVLMLVYMTVGMIRTGKRVSFAVPDIYRIHINPSGAEEEVKVYTAEDISVPFLFGFINPKIYLPYDLIEEDRIHVIRHEIAHIKRFDHILKPAFFVVLAVHWYNPLVWVAFKLFSTDMEIACDEAVVDGYDADTKNDYILALLSAAGKNHDMRMFSLPFGNAPIKERINRVIAYKRSGWEIRVSAIVVIVVVSMIFATVHVNAGQENTVITDYDLVIPVIDEDSGERYLLIPYYKDLTAYEMVESDDTLEAEVKEKSDQFWYERDLSDYTIKRDAPTNLEYIVKNGDALWEGHVLLRNDRDRKKYDELAQDYSDRYTQVIPDAETGYIYAAEEVKGLSERHENGFLFLQTGTLMYIDLKDPQAYGWRLALTTEEYMRLEKWMSESMDNDFDHTNLEAWKPVLDKLDIDYGANIDTDSKQYKAAYDALMGESTDFPPRGMSVEQAQEQLRYNMKQFDEDGDPVSFGTVPGMLVTEENDKDRRTIIQIPDEIKQMMFDLNKEEFIKWNGMGGDTQRSDVYRTYQEQAPKDERLKGTWTLGQYERIYIGYFIDVVRSVDPDWQPGDDFDSNLINGITRDQIEMYVYSDGSELIYDPQQFITESVE